MLRLMLRLNVFFVSRAVNISNYQGCRGDKFPKLEHLRSKLGGVGGAIILSFFPVISL